MNRRVGPVGQDMRRVVDGVERRSVLGRLADVLRGSARAYWTLTGMWILLRLGTLAVGLLFQRLFDALGADGGVWLIIALVAGIEAGRLCLQFGVMISRLEPRVQYGTTARLRHALLGSALRGPEVTARTTPGESLRTVGEDVDETGFFVAWAPTNLAHWIFVAASVTVMMRIDAVVTGALLALLVLLTLVTALAHSRFLRHRRATRAASGEVAGALREMLGAVSAVRAAAAEPLVAAHLTRLNGARAKAAVREELYAVVQRTVIGNAAPIGVGVVLLLVAGRMDEGAFSVGDLALFAFYLQMLTEALGSIGMLSVRLQRVSVALGRIARFLGGRLRRPLERAGPPLAPGPTGKGSAVTHSGPEPAPPPLRELTVRGLTARHPGTRHGIADVDLTVERHTVTVVTGRVGSGKSTLVRAVLGLLPHDRGTVLWNGEPVADPAAFLVAPRCGYTPQVPRLFSGTVRENVLLGRDDAVFDEAVRLAVLEPDLAVMQDGPDTVVGPRGLRLSGGQVQRAAIARMLAGDPELLVLDDVSSALDPETEHLLWERLLDGTHTVLAVSHRPALLRAADRVVVLVDGRTEASGTFDEVMATSAEMGRIWTGAGP
ncbi:ABC transporter ATP-binding protein [Streptomyces sp. DH41]|uniref:ABC transporter ATP-binding protein n=1 Tax=Streptomyces sp. DH41 TaxID=3040125 RepID=UPI0024419EB4|nr:ABC transporter ATP-binding protein [Streptomyces sp. DH41]MDG9727000.1 ABC transporter ATP-binding protein [Streptomyces sp. DH41]